MRLLDLLYKIDPELVVWISTSQNDSDCIYFGEVGKVELRTVRGYEVVSIYPEKYPAIFCTGITVIVREEEVRIRRKEP